MKSVGEVMAIGRTFQESLQKALRGLETGIDGLVERMPAGPSDDELEELRQELRMPGAERLLYVADAFRLGLDGEEISRLSGIDPWLGGQIENLVEIEAFIEAEGVASLAPARLRGLKRKLFSDSRLAKLLGRPKRRSNGA